MNRGREVDEKLSNDGNQKLIEECPELSKVLTKNHNLEYEKISTLNYL
jgi:hypothetical protein